MPANCCIPFIAGALLADMTWASWTSRVYKHSVNQNLQLRLTWGQVRFWSVKSRNEFKLDYQKHWSWKQLGNVEVCFTAVSSVRELKPVVVKEHYGKPYIYIFFFPLSLEIWIGWVSAGSNLWLMKVQGTRSDMLLLGIQLNKPVIIKTDLKIQTLHIWSITSGKLLRLTCSSLLFPIGVACVKSLLDTAVSWFTGGMGLEVGKDFSPQCHMSWWFTNKQ